MNALVIEGVVHCSADYFSISFSSIERSIMFTRHQFHVFDFEFRNDLAKLGLLIEPFGTTAVAIRGVPVGLGKVDAAVLVEDLLNDLTEWDSVSSLEMRVQPVLASLACHGAVRAGRALAPPEIQQLIHDWVQEGLIMTCPHGRRTAFRLSTDELAKLFGRVGWA